MSATRPGRQIAAVLTPTLSAPGSEQAVDIVNLAHSPAHGQRDEDLLGGSADHVIRRLAVAAAGGDIKEGQLVGA